MLRLGSPRAPAERNDGRFGLSDHACSCCGWACSLKGFNKLLARCQSALRQGVVVTTSAALVSLGLVKALVQFVETGAADELVTLRNQLDHIAELDLAKGTGERLFVGVEWILHYSKAVLKFQSKNKLFKQNYYR